MTAAGWVFLGLVALMFGAFGYGYMVGRAEANAERWRYRRELHQRLGLTTRREEE